MGAPVSVGDVIAAKYEVEQVLGRGGMGVVVAARHLHLDTRVALKFLLPHALVDAEAVQRFTREARAAALLRGEHVARVRDVGTLDTGAPYIVMEHLTGTDLAEVIAGTHGLDSETAAHYVLQACVAMAEAHAAGIIHRDLKPQNLFRTTRPDGTALIKVLDFGISKLLPRDGETDVGQTSANAVLGSPAYMSPEQTKSSRNVGPQADVWSLGAILYELLSGRRPFNAATVPELFAEILLEDPTPLCELAPDVSPELGAVVMKCLMKPPAARFGSVTDLAEALAPHAGPKGAELAESVSRVAGLAGNTPTITPAQLAASAKEIAMDETLAPTDVGADTTHGLSVGQVANDTDVDGSRGGFFAAIAAIAVIAVVVAVFVVRNMGDDGAEPRGATGTSFDAAPEATPASTAIPEQPTASVSPVDAGAIADGETGDRAEPTSTSSSRPRTRSTKPAAKPKPESEPTAKPPAPRDPFGTLQ